MKIIVSHDIDHIYWSDHWFRDLYIPKLWVRTALQLLKGQISASVALARINFLSEKRLNRIDELTTYLKAFNIPSTFFLGFANGLNLSYSNEQAGRMAAYLQNLGFGVGVHGIAYNDESGLAQEYAKASSFISSPAGIRMHYLRYESGVTPKLLAKTGYSYDSTEYQMRDPYRFDTGLWSFPIGVMDTYAVSPKHQNLEEAKRYTLDRLNEAKSNGQEYFVINTHDSYFDDKAYALYKDWFVWLIDYLLHEGNEFISFARAMKNLESSDLISSSE